MIEAFASKGQDTGGGRGGKGNATVVRRVMQVVADLGLPGAGPLRVLDLACGEGVYSIETALRGHAVHAVDGRTERMQQGEGFARRLQLDRLRFEQQDVRKITLESHGAYDFIYFLGILYHLDVPDSFQVMENLARMCRRALIIDTHIALEPNREFAYQGRIYHGIREREHEEADPESVRRGRLLMSLDNPYSFWFSRSCLVRFLRLAGFTSVYECLAPLDELRRADRVTLVACKGEPVRLATYPWINDRTEDEIQAALISERAALDQAETRQAHSMKRRLRLLVNRVLRSFGYEFKRI
jgi:SAM-dependent methyltransferase